VLKVEGPVFSNHRVRALPNGTYIGDNLRRRTLNSMTLNNVGFSLDSTPNFNTTRTDLRIHPDGNTAVTLGCIGLNCSDEVGGFYNWMNLYMTRISNSIPVDVNIE
jgi:hypothetical protein